MYKRILVPTDGSALSLQAAEAAVAFARGVGAELVAVSIAQPFPMMAAEAVAISGSAMGTEELMNQAADNVAKVAALAAAAGVPCHGMTSLAFFPHEEIINAARDQQCDLIMMASHGRHGLSKLIAGSVTQKVLADSAIPVLVLRPGAS
ncbi:universal stress protein [Massilia sp. R2A-15]|uniref:universal stress protein n=1 Tax=Massilia sp. R2A-15 TaxID=3064278 RepID=UPI002734ACF3|nr:universal stress protein [Massilia sp. R2A-15]WLI90843.1 universal stress protein [Massilia sp. R2A-15]